MLIKNVQNDNFKMHLPGFRGGAVLISLPSCPSFYSLGPLSAVQPPSGSASALLSTLKVPSQLS